MITTQQQLLCTILDCGTDDLLWLDDIGYDVNDIVEELLQEGRLSYNEIWREVFLKGIEDLENVIKTNKDIIVEEIQDKLEEESEAYTQEELEEFPEHQELMKDLYLITSGALECLDGRYQYWVNCSARGIQLDHLDFFHRYLADDIEDIERKMGMSFYG